MRFRWPKKSILELFNEANKNGESNIQLPTNRDAELFSFALYNFRRRTEIGKTFKHLTISVEDNKIKIFKPIEIEIKQTGT